MEKNYAIVYSHVEFSKELLTSFAKALVPEIRKFYDSDEGKAYFESWLLKHPEYSKQASGASLDACSSVQSTKKEG